MTRVCYGVTLMLLLCLIHQPALAACHAQSHDEQASGKSWRHNIMDATGYVTAGVAGAAAGPGAASMGLGALGFSSVGPVAGSIAASAMSTAGAIQAGSWYAFAQSAAMGGTMLVTLPATVATAGTGLALYSQRKHICKGASWVYNKWTGRSAEDEAKQTPDAEDAAKQTPNAEYAAKQAPNAEDKAKQMPDAEDEAKQTPDTTLP